MRRRALQDVIVVAYATNALLSTSTGPGSGVRDVHTHVVMWEGGMFHPGNAPNLALFRPWAGFLIRVALGANKCRGLLTLLRKGVPLFILESPPDSISIRKLLGREPVFKLDNDMNFKRGSKEVYAIFSETFKRTNIATSRETIA